MDSNRPQVGSGRKALSMALALGNADFMLCMLQHPFVKYFVLTDRDRLWYGENLCPAAMAIRNNEVHLFDQYLR